jgi:hypothetical protein
MSNADICYREPEILAGDILPIFYFHIGCLFSASSVVILINSGNIILTVRTDEIVSSDNLFSCLRIRMVCHGNVCKFS